MQVSSPGSSPHRHPAGNLPFHGRVVHLIVLVHALGSLQQETPYIFQAPPHPFSRLVFPLPRSRSRASLLLLLLLLLVLGDQSGRGQRVEEQQRGEAGEEERLHNFRGLLALRRRRGATRGSRFQF